MANWFALLSVEYDGNKNKIMNKKQEFDSH